MSVARHAIFGWGAGGHARSVIDAIEFLEVWEIRGLIDSDPQRWGSSVGRYPVLGGESVLASLLADGVQNAFIGVGGVGDNTPRSRVFEQLLKLGLVLPAICHPTSRISPTARIGRATVVLSGAIIGAGVVVGDNVIVNTGAIIDHDCDIGSHCHVSTGSRMGGSVRVGSGAHIGIGSTVREGVVVGERAIIGAGAVVLADVLAGVTVVGVPARVLKRS